MASRGEPCSATYTVTLVTEMRYISFIDDLILYSQMTPSAGQWPALKRPVYLFRNGELIVGDATQGGVGNEIVYGNDDDPNALMRIFPTDLNGENTIPERCGLNRLFWEAPYIVLSGDDSSYSPPAVTGQYRYWPGSPAISYPIRYKVISGSVTYNGRTYRPIPDGGQDTIVVVQDGGPITLAQGANAATIALALPLPVEDIKFDPRRHELFRAVHLLRGDEAQWDPNSPGSYVAPPYGWIYP